MLKLCGSIPVVVILCCYATNASAVLDVVITSAARTEQNSLTTPASITVITSEEIEASGAAHIVDVLRGHGGIHVSDTFGDGSRVSIGMRGFSESASSNTLIMVDGRRLNNVDLSAPNLNNISLKDVERIEITQGSAGVLYGDQAVGGVINIITRKPEAFDARVRVDTGSYHNRRLQLALAKKHEDGFFYRVSGELRKAGNYRDNNDLEYSNALLHAGSEYATGSVYFELLEINEILQTPGSLLESEIAVDRRQSFVDFNGDFTDVDTSARRIGIRQMLIKNWSFEAEYADRDEERLIQQSFRGFNVNTPSSLERRQREFTPRVIGSFSSEYGDTQFTLGIDYYDTDFASELTASSDNQIMQAAYAQVVLPYSKHVSITAGVRRASLEDDFISPTISGKIDNEIKVRGIGVLVKPRPAWRLFARVDENFRFPLVDEISYTSPGVLLRPQTGLSFETGTEWRSDSSSMKAVFYRLKLEDEIAFDPTAPTPVGGFFPGANVNFGETTHKGIILELGRELSSTTRIAAAYTFTEAIFDNGAQEGKHISGVPENSARVSLDHRFNGHWHGVAEAIYVGSKYLEGDNDNLLPKLENYDVWNIGIDYARKHWKFGARINNVLDKEYVENANAFGSRFPMPERNIVLTGEWKFR